MTRLPAPKTSPFAPFQFPAFRAIWTANLASSLGVTVQSVAAAWLMTDLTSSHQLVALVQASSIFPILLLGIVAGAIADNFDRRRVMLAAQMGMFLISALLAGLTFAGLVSPVSLLCLTLLLGCGTALNGPAWQASVRLQVGHEHLPQAIALNTIAFNLARSVGPALGGLLISLTGPASAFALNTLSYVALIIVLLRWKPESKPIERKPILPAIMVGLKFCASSGPLRRVLTRGFCFGFGAAGYQALLPSLVRSELNGTEVDYGLCLAAFGLGSVFAALWVGKARARLGTERLLQVAGVVFALAMVPIILAPTLSMVMVCGFVAGNCWVLSLTTLNVAMQLRSPESILGRCLSIYQAVTFGSMAVGSYGLGLIADLFSVSAGFVAAAIWVGVTSIVLHYIAPMPRPEEGRVLP